MVKHVREDMKNSAQLSSFHKSTVANHQTPALAAVRRIYLSCSLTSEQLPSTADVTSHPPHTHSYKSPHHMHDLPSHMQGAALLWGRICTLRAAGLFLTTPLPYGDLCHVHTICGAKQTVCKEVWSMVGARKLLSVMVLICPAPRKLSFIEDQYLIIAQCKTRFVE